MGKMNFDRKYNQNLRKTRILENKFQVLKKSKFISNVWKNFQNLIYFLLKRDFFGEIVVHFRLKSSKMSCSIKKNVKFRKI